MNLLSMKVWRAHMQPHCKVDNYAVIDSKATILISDSNCSCRCSSLLLEYEFLSACDTCMHRLLFICCIVVLCLDGTFGTPGEGVDVSGGNTGWNVEDEDLELPDVVSMWLWCGVTGAL